MEAARRGHDRFVELYGRRPRLLAQLKSEQPVPVVVQTVASPWIHLQTNNEYLSRAMAAYAKGDRFASIADAHRALAVGEPDAWALLAACHGDKPSLARLVIEVARERGSVTPALEVVDGDLALTLGRRAEAEAAFRRALMLAPDNADAQAGLHR